MRVLSEIRDAHRGLAARVRVAWSRLRAPIVARLESRMSEAARRARLLFTEVAAAVEVAFPVRLINHRYCLTSKPTYVRATAAAALRERVVGLYAAIVERVSRLRRPMARATATAVSALRRLIMLLLKRHGDRLTRIIKAASGWATAVLEYLKVSPALFATLRGTVARVLAAVIGRREEYYRGGVRHCSTYAIIRGLPFRGVPSVWYHWHRRWVACEGLCSAYRGVSRGICYTTCEDLLSKAEPRNVGFLWPRIVEYVNRVMARVAG